MKWKVYQDCYKCPLDVFLNCLFDGQLEDLIISGDPPVEELQKAWNQIHSEHSKLEFSESYNLEFELVKEINALYANIVLVDSCVDFLKVCYSPEIVQLLNNLLLRCDLKEGDSIEEVYRKLKGVSVRAKKLVANLQIKQNELNKIQAASKGGEAGRDYFSKMLMILSKENGYAVREKEITVYQFFFSVKELKNKVTRQKAATKKQ